MLSGSVPQAAAPGADPESGKPGPPRRSLRLRWPENPLGVAPTVIAACAVLAGVLRVVVLDPAPPADLEMWTFGEPHIEAYSPILERLEEEEGVSVDIRLINYSVIERRFLNAVWAGITLPDLIELPAAKLDPLLRGPIEGSGLIDLRPYLERPASPEGEGGGEPLIEQVPEARLAEYTHDGVIFGLPHDVHPVAIAYRRDLFEEAGIDASELTTWDEFVEAGRRITRARGPLDERRFMLAFSDVSHHDIRHLLSQRGISLMDAEGNCRLDDPEVAETIAFAARLLGGEGQIADGSSRHGAPFYEAIASGTYAAFFCPDWLTANIETNLPQLAGKMALMPLPAFVQSDGTLGRRTAASSGTMIGISADCEDPELAFAVIKELYANPEEQGKLFEQSKILPPFRDAWDLPAFTEPREYWSGQAIGSFFAEMAEDLPTRAPSAFNTLAMNRASAALASSAAYYRVHGEEGFEEFVERTLAEEAETVRRQMRRNPF